MLLFQISFSNVSTLVIRPNLFQCVWESTIKMFHSKGSTVQLRQLRKNSRCCNHASNFYVSGISGSFCESIFIINKIIHWT